jgi:hypothetical protein
MNEVGVIELLALFLATWAQVAAIWYKVGKVEQHVKDINGRTKI